MDLQELEDAILRRRRGRFRERMVVAIVGAIVLVFAVAAVTYYTR